MSQTRRGRHIKLRTGECEICTCLVCCVKVKAARLTERQVPTDRTTCQSTLHSFVASGAPHNASSPLGMSDKLKVARARRAKQHLASRMSEQAVERQQLLWKTWRSGTKPAKQFVRQRPEFKHLMRGPSVRGVRAHVKHVVALL